MPKRHGIEFSGEETTYKGERQVVANFLKPYVAITNKGALGWLLTKPVKGVGPKTIEKIQAHYHNNLIEALNDPELLIKAGIRKTLAHELSDQWMNVNLPSDILELFNISKLTPSLVAKCVKVLGSQLSDIVKNDPWKLASEVSGIGFAACDEIARHTDVDMSAFSRYEAAIKHIVTYEIRLDGHNGVSKDEIRRRMSKLRMQADQTAKVIDTLLGLGQLIEDPETALIFDPKIYYYEKKTAEKIGRLIESTSGYSYNEFLVKIEGLQNENSITLDRSQVDAIFTSLNNKLSIITGGPGTGKSTSQNFLVKLLEDEGEEILLLAPTGKAAKRLSETTGKPAFTIHRGLGFDATDFSFNYNEDNPLKIGTLIIDEFSMVDTELAYNVFNAVSDETRVILVGDEQQLPSVSSGQVLSDLMNSGIVPVSELKRIHRQGADSGIIAAAHDIKSGANPTSNDTDFIFHQVTKQEEIIPFLLDRITKMKEQGVDVTRDLTILTPMRKNDFGSTNLNQKVKELINPIRHSDKMHSVEIRSRWWSVGDRVMAIRNNYDLGVFNGTTGFIEKIKYDEDDEPSLMISFDDEHSAIYTPHEINELDLASVTTIHKSQGSEQSHVILLCLPAHSFMLRKNLVYTAITRAKQKIQILGARESLRLAIQKSDQNKRKTALPKLL